MMACHAARVIRQRHKAEHDMLETDLSPGWCSYPHPKNTFESIKNSNFGELTFLFKKEKKMQKCRYRIHINPFSS
jgi:hypothetical protein